MKVIQTIAVEALDVVLTLTEQSSGRVLARRVWQDAAKYINLQTPEGVITLTLPQQVGLNIKPGGN